MAVEPAIAPARSAAGGPDPAGKGNNQLDLSEAAGRAVDEVLDRLGSSAGGLTTAEARNRFGAVGSNAIDQRQVTGWNILVSQPRRHLPSPRERHHRHVHRRAARFKRRPSPASLPG